MQAETKVSKSYDVSSWKIRRRKQQRWSCPAENPPEEIGSWTKKSDTEGGQFLYGDKSGLPFYKKCKLPQDLNAGYPDSFVEKQELGIFVGHILKVIRDSQSSPDQTNQDIYDVITFRNNLNKIGLTLHQPRDSWTIDACILDGMLVLEIVPEEEQIFPGWHKFMYYGYKFEALCTGEENKVDSTAEFGTCVKLTLDGLKLVIGAEIDCCDPAGSSNNPNLQDYVELKTYRMPQDQKKYRKMVRNKHPRWWLQSWLAGVPRMILGNRDDAGILREIHQVQVSQLLQISWNMGVEFDQWEMIGFLIEILKWMRDCVNEVYQGQHVRFRYDLQTLSIDSSLVTNSDLFERMQQVWSKVVAKDSQSLESNLKDEIRGASQENPGTVYSCQFDSR